MSNSGNLKKAAVIGCGKFVEGQEGWAIGHAHGGALTELSDQVELYGVDLSPENLAAFGERFKLPQQQLIASTDALYEAFIPDIVAICTWPKLHAPMAIEAMEKGVKGVVIEKPIALDVGEINAILGKAKEVGASVSIAHQRCYQPAFQILKKVANSGALGTPVNVHAHVGDNWDILSWTSHWFDMANFIFDSAPDYVLAGMDVADKRIYQQAVENASVIFAEYPNQNGAFFLTGPRDGADVRISGPKGFAYIGEEKVFELSEDGIKQYPIPKGVNDFKELYLDLFEEMSGGKESLCSINRCWKATEMAYAAHESARTARKVKLPTAMHAAPLEIMQHPEVHAIHGKKVLLYADAHFGGRGREGISECLNALTGEEVQVIDAETFGLDESHVEGMDLLVIYHTQNKVDETTASVLQNWVDAGKALCIIHAGLGAWPEWEAYKNWCGLSWDWEKSYHPYAPVKLTPTADGEVDFSFSEAWLPKDEVFVRLTESAPVEVDLLAEISAEEVYPAAWHLRELKNVAVWMPGHCYSSWKVPSMQNAFGATLKNLFEKVSRLAQQT